MKKLLTILLSVLLVMSLVLPAMASTPMITGQIVTVKTAQPDLTGKTVVLHTNDVHGALAGYAYIPALRAAYETAGAEVIVVDAGDFTQGNPYVSLSKGHSAIEMMNAAGYDVVTLGNHEFDFGYEQLMENLKDANFKTVCANVYHKGTTDLILDPSVIVETASGLKVGFFGLETPETATKVNPALITKIDFSTFDQLYTAAQAAVDGLADADVVIGLCHLGIDKESAANGYRSTDLLAHVNGVDFVIDGHSHTTMTIGENGEPIQSTGTQFAYIGAIVIDNATKTIVDNYLHPVSCLSEDEAVAEQAAGIMAGVDEAYGAPFATSEILLNGERDPGNRTEETNLGDLITDAMVWCVAREGGIEQVEPSHIVGITNGGGIRATINPGEISMKDINTVLPFGNTVAVVYVTGAELLEALEASTFCTPKAIGGYPQTSGIQWTIDTTKEYDQGDVYITISGGESSYFGPKSIQRVTIESVNGEPFDPEATYAVVTNNFIAEGGDTYNVFNRAYEAGTGFDTGITMDQAVVEYVTEALNCV
ncbi:MAG: bifunctional UDP-sugar hydrolase/5'-nucleotidase, partial [Clostridia bacterium]